MDHWIFLDFDGVIIDSEGISLRSWRSFFGEEKSLAIADICGNTALENAKRLFPDLVDTGDVEDIVKEKLARDCAQLDGGLYPLVAQASDTIVNLSEKYSLAIVTSNAASIVEDHLRHYNLAAYVAHKICANDVLRRKPSPDLYLEALRICGTTPACAVAIEDSAAGLQAANAAGVSVIGFGEAVEHSTLQADWLASFQDASRVLASLEQAFRRG